MSKRFHDTNIWDEDWFISLPKDYRSFWLYVKDKCDHSGIFKPNVIIFNKLYDCEVSAKKALDLINIGKDRIVVLDNGRWLIPDFISFQYGNHLNPNNRVHFSILRLLETNGVNLTSIRGLKEDNDTLKDKNKDKDKDKENKNSSITPGQEIYNYYAKTIKAGASQDAIKSINKLLKTGFTKEDLIGRIDAYKKQLTAKPTDFIIQANNFFGEKARYKDFAPIKIVDYLPPDQNCKACKGIGKVQTGEGQLIMCKCVKEK